MSGGRYLAQERAAFPSTRDAFDAEPNRSKMQNNGMILAQKALGSMKIPCSQQGCPNLTDGGGKCPGCCRTAEKERGTTLQRGYAARLAQAPSSEAGDRSHLPDPHRVQGTIGSEVDHTEPIRLRPDLRLVWNNLQSSCCPYNQAKARRQARRPGYANVMRWRG